MSFKVINEGFICQNCGEKNPPAEKTCRNHCKKCLYSLHVDQDFPGDRLSDCHGLMKPLYIDGGPDNYIIHHQCLKCGKIIKNKVASDDDIDEIIKIAKKAGRS